MEQLKVDRDKDIEAAKEAAKTDLMKHYWGRLAEAYQIRFHDRGKEDPFDRYFEGPEDYDSKANTTSVLPPFPEVLENDAAEEEVADPDGDQVMAEDEDDENEDASRYELRLKKRRDRNEPNATDGSGVVPNPTAAGDQVDNIDWARQETPLDGSVTDVGNAGAADGSGDAKGNSQDPPISGSGITQAGSGVTKD